MATEAKRACGYRKVGGLYLCSTGEGLPCCKMPILLHVCPTCGHGIKQGRGWQWIDPIPWITGSQCREGGACPLARGEGLGDKVGLLWIGTQFYPTPQHFMEEANRMGISKRIAAVPKGFKLGEHWVFLAHPRVKRLPSMNPQTGADEDHWQAGVFRVIKPTAIEKIVTQSQAADADEMAKLAKQGITPVIVPDGDRDHSGSVWDRDTEESPATLL